MKKLCDEKNGKLDFLNNFFGEQNVFALYSLC